MLVVVYIFFSPHSDFKEYKWQDLGCFFFLIFSSNFFLSLIFHWTQNLSSFISCRIYCRIFLIINIEIFEFSIMFCFPQGFQVGINELLFFFLQPVLIISCNSILQIIMYTKYLLLKTSNTSRYYHAVKKLYTLLFN